MNQVPAAPIAWKPAGHAWAFVASRQTREAEGAQNPVPQAGAEEASEQKLSEVCQVGTGAVAPTGSQFGHGDVPLHGTNVAGWLAESDVVRSANDADAASHCREELLVTTMEPWPTTSICRSIEQEPLAASEQPHPEAQPTLIPVWIVVLPPEKPVGQAAPASTTVPIAHPLGRTTQLQVQEPLTQVMPDGHATHVPLAPPPHIVFDSAESGTQLVPLQHPVPHDAVVHAHCPLLHVCPLPHARPHLPQLPASVCKFVQVPLQDVCPVEQQTPAEHTPLAPQLRPHTPQLPALLLNVTQVPLQFV